MIRWICNAVVAVFKSWASLCSASHHLGFIKTLCGFCCCCFVIYIYLRLTLLQSTRSEDLPTSPLLGNLFSRGEANPASESRRGPGRGDGSWFIVRGLPDQTERRTLRKSTRSVERSQFLSGLTTKSREDHLRGLLYSPA